MSDEEADNTHLNSKGWTEEMCLELIREYRERELLWNPQDSNYYKPHIKGRQWAMIGKKMGRPPDNCKNKLNILLSSFRREKAKIMNSVIKGELYTSVWFAFKELSFLMDKELTKKSRRSKIIEQAYAKDEPPEFPSDDCDEFENIDNSVQESTAKRRRLDTSDVGPSHFEDYQDTYSDNSRLNAISVPANQNIFYCEDEETLSFLNFICTKMKKYDNKMKVQVQKALLDIIFRTDMSFYSSNDPLSEHDDEN